MKHALAAIAFIGVGFAAGVLADQYAFSDNDGAHAIPSEFRILIEAHEAAAIHPFLTP